MLQEGNLQLDCTISVYLFYVLSRTGRTRACIGDSSKFLYEKMEERHRSTVEDFIEGSFHLKSH